MKAELKRKRASSASLFLMELVVAIMFFTLAASVCITIFVRAHLQSENAKALNHAINICSDAAELVRTSDSVSGCAANFGTVYEYATAEPGEDGYEISVYFNDDYLPTAESGLAKVETVSLSETDTLLMADIRFTDANGNDVYSLSVTHAKPATNGSSVDNRGSDADNKAATSGDSGSDGETVSNNASTNDESDESGTPAVHGGAAGNNDSAVNEETADE